jgi:anaerobic ribonucleoside-triphosphate reductase activating protein
MKECRGTFSLMPAMRFSDTIGMDRKHTMYYGTLKTYDIADGEGVRVTLFVSGCTNRCPGCFQPETWDFHYGKPFTEETEAEILAALDKDYIQGLTLLGGDPMETENQRALLPLLRKVRRHLPEKDIWCYTGFVYERDLLPGGKRHAEGTDEMLSLIDVLVDGPYVNELRNISLKFRGSENQRVIDLRRTREEGRVILYLE